MANQAAVAGVQAVLNPADATSDFYLFLKEGHNYAKNLFIII